MTNKQQKLFSEIVDLNWDVKQENNIVKKMDLIEKLGEKKQALKKDMGEAEYNKFMDMGTKMFAPKD